MVSKPDWKLIDEKTLKILFSRDDFNSLFNTYSNYSFFSLDFPREIDDFFWPSIEMDRTVPIHAGELHLAGKYVPHECEIESYDRYLPWVSGFIRFDGSVKNYISRQLEFWKDQSPDINVFLILTSIKGQPPIISEVGKSLKDGEPYWGERGPMETDLDPETYNLEVKVFDKDGLEYIPKMVDTTDPLPITKDNKKTEMPFGHIDGTKEGQVFANREELGLSGIHTPPQAGIWGRQNEGSASIVLSGGYADDIDDDDYILYTGQGGQDKPGGSQVRDQEFTLGNKALQLNKEYNLPLRVTRGYQVEKGPDEGYRYDGLYYVTDYERVEGKEGFQICRFHLQREVGGSPIENIEHSISPAERVEYTGNRVKRNVSFAEQIKDLYDNTCQVCKVFLKTPIEGVGISEAAHIKAIGKPHNGDDTKANMLCLCPNHHAQFDRYTFYIEPETLEIIGLDEYKGTSISINKKHKVNVEYFEYQKQQYLQKN